MEAVTKLAQDPSLARELGRGGQEHIARHFDVEALAERYLGLLEDEVLAP